MRQSFQLMKSYESWLGFGEARCIRNPLVPTIHVYGQKDTDLPYIVDEKEGWRDICISLMLTINHYNKTSEKKAFEVGGNKLSYVMDNVKDQF